MSFGSNFILISKYNIFTDNFLWLMFVYTSCDIYNHTIGFNLKFSIKMFVIVTFQWLKGNHLVDD